MLLLIDLQMTLLGAMAAVLDLGLNVVLCVPDFGFCISSVFCIIPFES